jgi:hypothetical protein
MSSPMAPVSLRPTCHMSAGVQLGDSSAHQYTIVIDPDFGVREPRQIVNPSDLVEDPTRRSVLCHHRGEVGSLE